MRVITISINEYTAKILDEIPRGAKSRFISDCILEHVERQEFLQKQKQDENEKKLKIKNSIKNSPLKFPLDQKFLEPNIDITPTTPNATSTSSSFPRDLIEEKRRRMIEEERKREE